MLYFSYGSNMSTQRLKERVPSANFVAVARLDNHHLKFHKIGQDGSCKCDAMLSSEARRFVLGVVFRICPSEKPLLDRKEGLGNGYEEKTVVVSAADGERFEATTYYATHIDATLRPFHWYKEHVLRGAREFGLPESYISLIEAVDSIPDPEPERHHRELAVYR